MTQSMMLESAVNRTARSMQISANAITATDFKKAVCSHAIVLKDCEANLNVELSPVATKTDIPTDVRAAVQN